MKEPDNRVDHQASSQCLRPSQSITRTTVFDDHCPPATVLIPRRFSSAAICRANGKWASSAKIGRIRSVGSPASPDHPTMIALNRQKPPGDSELARDVFPATTLAALPSNSPASTAKSRRQFQRLPSGNRAVPRRKHRSQQRLTCKRLLNSCVGLFAEWVSPDMTGGEALTVIAGCEGRDFPTLLDERAPCLTKVVEDKSPVEWPSLVENRKGGKS